MHIEYRVTDDHDHVKVSTILRSQLKFSRGAIRRLKRCAGLTVNDQTVRLNALVQTGDLIRVNFQDDEQPVIPQEMPLDILFEDEHLLAVNKSSNMLVHPLSYHLMGTLANGVIDHWQRQGLSCKFRAASRLDKDTSGVILIAKNSYSCHQLSVQMNNGLCRRDYLAVVHDKIAVNAGSIDFPIGRPDAASLIFGVTPEGKEAVTHYVIMQRFTGAAWSNCAWKRDAPTRSGST